MRKRFTYICPNCGVEIISRRPPDSSQAPTYCSVKCYREYRKKTHPKKFYHKVCEYCGQQFIDIRREARFCSLQCFGKSRRKDKSRICQQCGQTFYKQPSHSDQFCSWECYNQNRKENAIKICEICGNEFQTDISCQNERYCSRECFYNRPLTGIWKPCKNCGQKFYVVLSHAEGEQFCSRDCRINYQGPTSIEQLLIDELENRNIEYEFQYKFNRWSIDFAFPDYKLAIEADGIYWHSLPENIKRDRRKDKSLNRQGWTVLHFTGDEIRQSPSDCVDKILTHIKS